MDIRRYMSAVPGMDRFLTVDELNVGFERNVVLFACPHPNEPIGAMIVHHLALYGDGDGTERAAPVVRLDR